MIRPFQRTCRRLVAFMAARRRYWLASALVAGSWVLAAGVHSSAPSGADRASALQIQQQAVESLRDGAKAAARGDEAEFARAIGAAVLQLERLVARATWLGDRDRTALRETAAALAARAHAGASGYSPDADLAALDRIGYRLRGAEAKVELAFEGSFARGKAEEPVYGGHATAMGTPVVDAPVTNAAPEAQHALRFEAVRGQLTEATFGGGPSKWHLVESGGNGVALVDYDGDGRLDVYVVSGFELDERSGRRRIPHRNALYRNLGAMRFENVAAKAGVDAAAWGYGVCAGDFDDDGRLDLYVTNYGANLLYRNKGDGTFQELAAKAGVEAGGWSTGCAFLDADGDGDLDLYVARYVAAPEEEVAAPDKYLFWRGSVKVMLGPTGLPGDSDLFFENQGNGGFVEATGKSGLTDATKAYGFGVVATDYDGDGWTDLFVANDSNPNFLYRNRRGRGFESVGLAAGVALNGEARAQAGMGADAGDYDGDGRPDIALATFAFDHRSLFRNLGDGSFEDVTQASGVAAASFKEMGWGPAFLDADLDGALDLFFANGHLFPQVDEHPDLQESYAQKNQILRNLGGGRFRDVSATAGRGLAVHKCHRSAAVGDLDGDGDPDLVVSAIDEVPTLLENTQQSGNHWIGIDVRQRGKNPFAIGAQLFVQDASGRKQMREVRSGGGYLAHSDLRALFGLGPIAGPVTVEVRLLDRSWRFTDVPPDRCTTLLLDDAHRSRDARLGDAQRPHSAALSPVTKRGNPSLP